FGTDHLGPPQGPKKLLANHVATVTPLQEEVIGPQDRQLSIQESDSVGHPFENAIVLEQTSQLYGVLQLVSGDIHAIEFFAGNFGEGTQRIVDGYDVGGIAKRLR